MVYLGIGFFSSQVAWKFGKNKRLKNSLPENILYSTELQTWRISIYNEFISIYDENMVNCTKSRTAANFNTSRQGINIF